MHKILLLALATLLGGCGTTAISYYPMPAVTAPVPVVAANLETNAVPQRPSRTLLAVIDGTSNDPLDRTNVARLYELATNQNKQQLAGFYTEGVGSDGRVVGMAAGMGMGHDVRQAYRFIAEYWEPGDKVVLAGFSRGAFGIRILAGLIHAAGVPDFASDEGRKISAQRRDDIIDGLYDAVKTGNAENSRTFEQRRALLAKRQARIAKVKEKYAFTLRPDADIKAIALFDTVAAMGKPDGKRDPFNEGKEPYFDQLCNVENVYHAVSIDDTRAYDFTPILATAPRAIEFCAKAVNIDEVWFSGAHADIGGTYSNKYGVLEGHLPGVAMNWMLSRLEQHEIVPPSSQQYANVFDMIHDSQLSSSVWRLRGKRAMRDVMNWVERPKIHISVKWRLEKLFEHQYLYEGKCSSKGAREPALLCAHDIQESPFVKELKRRDCIDLVENEGYRLNGTAVRIANIPEVELGCVTLSFDTIEARDEYYPAARHLTREQPHADNATP